MRDSDTESSRDWQQGIDRRAFVRAGLLAAAGVGLSGPLRAQAAVIQPRLGAPHRKTRAAVRTVRLVAAPGEVEVAPGQIYRTWLYNGQFPGPEIRVKEGEQLRITVENQLPDQTTVHWHGIPVPNPMDGVPKLTQVPIPPGGTFLYDFPAEPAGSYIYHSHMGLQLDRGLLGPLVIEEATPHITFDREYTLLLDDFLPGEPRMQGYGAGRGRGRGRGCMTSGGQPPYEGLLVNGRLPHDPPQFETRRGERLRLRFINPGGATIYRVAIGGHLMIVTHADGRPVEPVKVDSFLLGMGERYDVIIEANNPGTWPIAAAAAEGGPAPARAILHYKDSARTTPRRGLPEGLNRGRRLRYSDLRSLEALPATGTPDRIFNLSLSQGMMMRSGGAWTINGQAYPNADLLEIREGEHIRVNMANHSMMSHPMHLHGHFFRTANALKDTVVVAPHMGRASFDFVADNPGRWFFHCHHLYHLHSGMAREVRYV